MEGTRCFRDDILVIGYSQDDAIKNTELVRKRFREYGMKANGNKTALLRTSIKKLDHQIEKQGIYPTDEFVQAILDAPQPKDFNQLRAYIELLNF